MKLTSIAIIFFLIACNEGKQATSKINYLDSIQEQRLDFLDSLHLLRFNDSAKWFMYTIQCDDSSKQGRVRDSRLVPKIPLAFLKLYLIYAKQQEDTLQLMYSFVINDSVIVEESTSQNLITNGVVFNVAKNHIIGYVKGEGIYSDTGISRSRYINTLQPEVIEFLRGNKEKLNAWLKQEALRRKLIQ